MLKSETGKIRLISSLLIQYYTFTETLTGKGAGAGYTYESRVLHETLEVGVFLCAFQSGELETMLHQTSLGSVLCLLPHALLIYIIRKKNKMQYPFVRIHTGGRQMRG